ncbi:NAD(P)-binding domain protein [Apiospora aurea]|uniref:3beta-hydroxysteroid 3-dehydrogenase n=1 Tax=Apiospora aurea TaxID=335848 RepID=A0ABR1QNB6_9PEZI
MQKGTILLTGANGGLGSAIVKKLDSDPTLASYHAIFTVRDATHTEPLHLNSTHDVVSLDLTKLDNVRRVAMTTNARVAAGDIPPIRALIVSAGYQDFGKQTWTGDGLDTTFVANYLGHWLLILLLLGSMDKEAGRIIYMGSQAHDPKDPRNSRTGAFTNPKYKTFVSDAASFHAIAEGKWSPATEDAGFRGGYRRYGASKLFLAMMQHELQARLDADAALRGNKICVVGVDPGVMSTGMQRLAPWVIRVLIFKILYPLIQLVSPNMGPRPTSRAADEALDAALGDGAPGDDGDEVKLPKDGYFYERAAMETSEESRDVKKRALVWRETVKLTGLKKGETALANWK